MASHAPRNFDEQATTFESRAGLPATACAAVADAVVRITDPAPSSLLVEVGAGTGQIGYALHQRVPRYLGFDASHAMLRVFAQRYAGGARAPALVIADASRHWPADDHSTSVIFGSRALHLLPLEHVTKEAFRLAAPDGAFLLVGRVKRNANDLRARMRHHMRACLAKLGYGVREGQAQEEALFAACVARGGTLMPTTVAAAWPVRHSASEVLQSWRNKSGLAGLDLQPAVKEGVLAEVSAWAGQTFGSLDSIEASEERYLLSVVRLPRISSSNPTE